LKLVLVALLLAFSAQPRAHALGSLIFEDNFTGPLNRAVWDPFVTDNNANGWPWGMQNSQGVPSSAGSADYDVPSAVQCGRRGGGVALEETKGTNAKGFTRTGSVICSYPDSHFGNTRGFTFTDAYVEIRAKMPAGLSDGEWPAIWFLAAPGSKGGEIDLFEGGFTKAGVETSHIMAVTLHHPFGTSRQRLYDTGGDLSAGYHTYALAYKSGEYIKCYFDGKPAASWTENVPTGRYFIILDNWIAASNTNGWHSQIDGSTPPSGDMIVKYVKAYALK
jgi:hypothetical protein